MIFYIDIINSFVKNYSSFHISKIHRFHAGGQLSLSLYNLSFKSTRTGVSHLLLVNMFLFLLSLQDELLGHVRIPLSTIERRIDGRPVPSR